MNGLVAECLTPRGTGGVAVLSLRGQGAGQALHQIGVVGPLEPGILRLVRLRKPSSGAGPRAKAGETLDEGLLCVRGPDHVELHVHGSPGLVDELLDLWSVGEPAESGRGTTTDVPPRSLEQWAQDWLPHAPSEAGARMLLDQVEGALRADLLRLAADPRPELARTLGERGRQAGFLLGATRVVLVGPANAGKSTLFNVLVGEDRVLASAQPGTTRDAVHEDAWFGPWPVALVDTAGERDAGGDQVEAAGQAEARRLRDGADWVLRLGAFGEPGPQPDLWTHGERPGAPSGAVASLEDPAGARAQVRRLFEARFELPPDPWSPGAAVPFVDELAGDLRAFASGQLSASELRRRLGMWLTPSA